MTHASAPPQVSAPMKAALTSPIERRRWPTRWGERLASPDRLLTLQIEVRRKPESCSEDFRGRRSRISRCTVNETALPVAFGVDQSGRHGVDADVSRAPIP
jgi:hypothetical protein